jgi:iron complex outermembrane recepter protein
MVPTFRRFLPLLGVLCVVAVTLCLPLTSARAQQSPSSQTPAMAAEEEKGTVLPVVKEQVVVTGTYDPIPLEEADRAVRSLDVRGLELVSNTWVDLLKLDASLDLRQRAPNGVQGDLSIRGGTFGQTLVLLNGLRLNDAQSGHHNLDIPVPMEALERVEILRGSGSTQYGSDAVGGVVNLISAAPANSEFRVRTAVGNFGVNQQRGVASAALGKLSQQLVFSRDFSTGFRENRDYRNLSLGSTTHYRTGLGNSSAVLGHSDRPFGADRFYGNFNSWERTKTWFASMRQEFGEKTEGAFAYRRHTDLFVLYRDRPQVFTNRHAVESYQGTLRRREELGTTANLYYGVEGYHDSIHSNNLGNHSRTRGAGYVNLDVRALRRFSFSIGGREEVYGSLERQFSPTLAAGAWLTQRLKLRAGASRAFRIPSYTDLYYHDPANRGTPDLRPEYAWSYEGGLDWHLSETWRGDVTVFQRRERDGIDYIRYSPTDIWRATNINRLRFTGVEASVTATPGRRRHWIDLRYTGLHGAQNALQGIYSRYVFNYPQHSGVASWQSSMPGGLLVRTRFGATQRYARDVYAVWDFYAARGKGRWQPFVQFSNLTNARYEEIAGVAMPGRAVVVGFQAWVFSRGK